ncbi:hypothetical protein AVEN_97295-1 [Araneus ventricosus]|uniref:BTB domain-containing protein n=1 Tax=Araneus ventricosus TaxID=182803 RepID=A0A4Y2VHZ6_ARAVE|nr:hypothetical protein AVEN_97295-1 [Araneus ventricosus]
MKMADAAMHRGSFRWDIYNPFLPLRRLEATFCHGSPDATQWKVTLEHMDKTMDFWAFSFSLELVNCVGHRFATAAESVLVVIKLNGERIARKEATNYCFGRRNRFRYCFEGNAARRPQMDPHRLVIKIKISLSGGAEGKGKGLLSDDEYLRILSSNLQSLLHSPKYSNMTLWSADRQRSFPVHSYIMDARWDNFFRERPLDANDRDDVETNISDGLLSDILKYMYSGTMDTAGPERATPSYTTELFQVIDRYRLHHLYKAFVKNELENVQVTRHEAFIESLLFPLDIVVGRPINNASRAWDITLDPEYELIFRIRVWSEAGNWLSYSVQSKCPSTVHVQLNLELVKGVAFPSVSHFHEQDWTIDPDATAESGPVLFLGCPETFGESDGTEIKHFIRCFLNVANGTKVDTVRSDSVASQNEFETLAVLGDHMRNLKERKFDTDMRILSSPGFLHEDVIEDRIHKDVFAARLPEWWRGIANVTPATDGGWPPVGIPDVAVSTLGSETLPFVLDCIYTGKVSNMPYSFLDAVVDFTRRTVFESLFDVVFRISESGMNR